MIDESFKIVQSLLVWLVNLLTGQLEAPPSAAASQSPGIMRIEYLDGTNQRDRISFEPPIPNPDFWNGCLGSKQFYLKSYLSLQE